MFQDFSNRISRYEIKLLRLKYRMNKIARRITKTEKNIYVWKRIPMYKEIWESAATQISAQFLELGEGIWEIRWGNQRTRISNHMVQLDDPVILDLAGNKPFCYWLMKNNDLPIPDYLTFRVNELIKARRFMEKNSGLFVIKPAIGTSAGMGVTTHIQSFQECCRAVALASLYCNEIIIERLVPGECYRFLILDGKMIHASRRSGIRVKGDGRSTISQLLQEENKRRKKLYGGHSLRPMHYDVDLIHTLQAQELSIEFVPKKEEHVLVKSVDCPFKTNVEVRTVYNENVTNLICPDLKGQAVKAAMLLNSKFAGVDVITHDPTVSLEKSGGVINEINTTPGLHHHYNLINNQDLSPAVHVLGYLLRRPKAMVASLNRV
jgi:D-alanine-D-alanine ligase-like ATP-grasp enzyme